MGMKSRVVKLGITVFGLQRMPIATVTIKGFANTRKPSTKMLCPQCNEKPSYQKANYKCVQCGYSASSWMGLKRVVASTGEPIEKTRLIEEKEEVLADLYVTTAEELLQFGVIDATKSEYGLTVHDETSAKNLKKLIIAVEKLGKVIVIRYKDTYEQIVGMLTLSISNRLIIKDIIPKNLLEAQETLTVNLQEVTPQELAEAEQLVQQLPQAKPEHFEIDDYRLTGLDAEPLKSEKVIALETIIQKAKQQVIA